MKKPRAELRECLTSFIAKYFVFHPLSKNIKIKICRTIILPVGLYVCETWSLILKEELRLWVCKNRVLRKISGSRKDEVTGDRRRLHIEELHDVHFTKY
jgi:hypothetical protein